MSLFLGIIFFIFGIVIGSFLNVVILRYNTGKSFGGRSACMSCRTGLSWYELIPVFSFLALMGRCKSCKTKISAQYPLVEITTGVLFTLLFLKLEYLFNADTFMFFAVYTYYAVLFAILVVIAFYDLKHKIIPDVLSGLFGLLAFAGLFLFSGDVFHLHLPWKLDVFSGFTVAVPFAVLWLVSQGTWMGLGDAKLALGLGWMLGIAKVFSGTLLAFWSGALISIVLLVFSKKYKIKSEIPFAPFLIFGAILAFFLELQATPFF